MILKQLLERLEYEVVQGSDKIEITTLINDSRKVEKDLCLYASAALSQTDISM